MASFVFSSVGLQAMFLSIEVPYPVTSLSKISPCLMISNDLFITVILEKDFFLTHEKCSKYILHLFEVSTGIVTIFNSHVNGGSNSLKQSNVFIGMIIYTVRIITCFIAVCAFIHCCKILWEKIGKDVLKTC